MLPLPERNLRQGKMKFSIDVKIKENRSLYWAGVLQTLYGCFELADVAAAVLISIGLIPNIYGLFIPATTEIGMFMETTPIIFIPIFFFFASLRVLSGYWILLNRAKGFWMACIILPLLVLLFNGYFQDSAIVSD